MVKWDQVIRSEKFQRRFKCFHSKQTESPKIIFCDYEYTLVWKPGESSASWCYYLSISRIGSWATTCLKSAGIDKNVAKNQLFKVLPKSCV